MGWRRAYSLLILYRENVMVKKNVRQSLQVSHKHLPGILVAY